MGDQVVVVDANAGVVYLRPDGTAYKTDVYNIGTPQECSYKGGPQRTTNVYGTLAGASDCTAGFQQILPTLDPTAPQLLLTEFSGRLVDQVGQLGSAALTALSGYQLATVSPILSAFEGSEVLQSVGLLPLLEALPGLGQAIQQELAVNTQSRIDAGDAEQFNPDGASNYNQFQRYLMALGGAQELEPLVSAERQRAVGILEDLGLSGFASGGYNTNFGIPSFTPTTFNPFPTTSSPVSTGGLGAIDTIGSALVNVIAALSRSGVIRGTVGELFNPQQNQAQAVMPQGAVSMGGQSLVGGSGVPTLLETLALALAGNNVAPSTSDGTMVGGALAGLENLFGVNQGGMGCGSRSLRVPMAQALGLYKMGCGKAFIPRRIFVDGPDGVPHVLYNAGPATIGSREAGLARSIARRSGYKLTRYGTGGARRRRRSPR